MKVFDLHCDTVSHVAWGIASSLSGNSTPKHISVDRLKSGGAYVQCLGLYGGKLSSNNFEWNYMRYLFELGTRLVLQEPELHLVTSMSQCLEDKVNVIFTVEDCGCMQGDAKNVTWAYDHGARMFGITHNTENAYGYPNSEDPLVMAMGLKPEGTHLVEQINELGALVDVSHLSYGGFWAVEKICKGRPFIASHSCAEGLHHHTRNLTDDMIRAIAEHGGIIGINFMSKFATGNEEMLYLRDITAQAVYMRNIGGIDCLALGSDFDGIGNALEFKDASGMGMIADALQESGFTLEETEKVMYKNALRVFSEVCG